MDSPAAAAREILPVDAKVLAAINVPASTAFWMFTLARYNSAVSNPAPLINNRNGVLSPTNILMLPLLFAANRRQSDFFRGSTIAFHLD